MTVKKSLYNQRQWVLLDSYSKLFENLETFFLVFLTWHPEIVTVLHDICQNSSTKEHHVFTTGRIFNTNLEFLFWKDSWRGRGGVGKLLSKFGNMNVILGILDDTFH